MPAAPHEHPIYKVSSLGRPVDPRFPSNKAILVVMAVVFVAGTAWGWFDSETWHGALLRGLHCSVVAFASWALGRELDPDRPGTAMIAVALSGAALVWQGDVDLWTLGGGLVAARIVNRTIGPGARATDLVAVLGLLAFAVFGAGRWSLALALAIALVLDAQLVGGTKDRWAWALACVGLVFAHVLADGLHFGALSDPLLVGAVTLAGLISIATLPAPSAACDQPTHTLHRRRVQGGMLAALLVGLLAQLEGSSAPLGMGVAACLLATLPGRALPQP